MDLEIKETILTNILSKYNQEITNLSIHNLAMIAAQSFFPRNTMVLGLNEPQRYVYLIVKGLSRSYYIDEDGNNVTKNFMLEGEFLIGEGLFSDTSVEAFDAVEDLQCLRFEAAALKKLIMSDDGLTKLYISLLEETIRYKMQREYGFQNLNAEQRYLEFQDIYGKAENRMPQNLIASYIGIKKESLSRLRKKMRNN
ncbi:Crp/Fnr family transcriptional regulator [Paucilactobacillus suebicus]|uniref:Crp Fnr family transcriptional regulator n=1 Tax=Paucilactobacillus suebicus DSM 5007 = KCTC 3549 TaxID=1423807 RepID=A0A0R1VYS5_9LACO|nr:Crp/Fnr family transcriptional regulator [Paucilactobacillus suebicus]KRM10801.1 Crp Fnr family transcriptional regulator [Paucilactobacillus suebicus DSM 5007 = KCTC 3549]